MKLTELLADFLGAVVLFSIVYISFILIAIIAG